MRPGSSTTAEDVQLAIGADESYRTITNGLFDICQQGVMIDRTVSGCYELLVNQSFGTLFPLLVHEVKETLAGARLEGIHLYPSPVGMEPSPIRRPTWEGLEYSKRI